MTSPPVEPPLAPGARVLDRLRSETAHAHRRLEAVVRLGPGAKITRDSYAAYLSRIGGFHRALERRLQDHAPLEASAQLGQRLRAARAFEDLEALGGAGEDLHEPDLPPLPTPAHALGALYVLEGSTLGAQVIRRQLVQQLGGTVGGALTYVDGYGERTGEMWRRLRTALCQLAAAGREAEDAIVAGANSTFEAIERFWREAEGAPSGTRAER